MLDCISRAGYGLSFPTRSDSATFPFLQSLQLRVNVNSAPWFPRTTRIIHWKWPAPELMNGIKTFKYYISPSEFSYFLEGMTTTQFFDPMRHSRLLTLLTLRNAIKEGSSSNGRTIKHPRSRAHAQSRIHLNRG